MSRLLALVYGTACYAVFLATFLYAIAFVAGIGVPKHIDNGIAAPTWLAIAIDAALLGLFALQHSGMARPAFKRWWTRIVPAPIERSTYVLASSAALILLFWQWRPLPALVWDVGDGIARTGLYAVSALGWLLVLVGSSSSAISNCSGCARCGGMRADAHRSRRRSSPARSIASCGTR